MLAALAVAVAALTALHRFVPNAGLRLGSLLENLLPWSGAAVVLLALCALLRRARGALVVLLLPAVVWAVHFGPLLLPGGPAGARELLVAQHNVADDNPDPAGTARALSAADADLVALEELVEPALGTYREALAARYPYHAVHGTVGLWSRYPITGHRPVDIKPRDVTEPWLRALRAVVRAPHGETVVYVAHLPSVRVGPGGLASARRDESAARLGALLAAEEADRLVLAGDLNGTVDDRGLAPLTSRLAVPERGFALSYPAALPVARIDQVFAGGGTVPRVRTLPATGSDHLPVLAGIAWSGPAGR
ncbi:endonuclease/exonuclease/phosphatase family protein [Streptomyces filamentosus]|uniref:endonuclease/exonuclease/phosphatase family protein n=1 Tax=Streptomyces filamentosus TaxID=67294 RepID=UPI001F448033|nr:endonuclease/exonuclease/phosphatase family protein [Streptomyces filamentosus]